jgi:hypothetical protein
MHMRAEQAWEALLLRPSTLEARLADLTAERSPCPAQLMEILNIVVQANTPPAQPGEGSHIGDYDYDTRSVTRCAMQRRHLVGQGHLGHVCLPIMCSERSADGTVKARRLRRVRMNLANTAAATLQVPINVDGIADDGMP